MADSAKGTDISTTASSIGCSPCGCSGAAKLTDEEIQVELQSLNPLRQWKLSEDMKVISRSIVCRHFQSAVDAINEISKVAESPDMLHHPDLHLTSYRNLEIRIYTHAAGGLTKMDFALAKRLDEINFDYSPKWLKENPQN
jgi:4a-hydroxytetrahydrobiopterin dehydratase